MLEFLVILSLAAVGSLVCLSADLVLKFMARKTHSQTIAAGPGRSASAASAGEADPVLAFGFTLACYGAISLALVSVLSGPLALERTCLAFALLCVGGLISEISSTTFKMESSKVDSDEDAPLERKPLSPPLVVALCLVLNLTFAVVSTGQGLIEIVPPHKAVNAGHAQEMDPIIVIAQRSGVSIDGHSEAL